MKLLDGSFTEMLDQLEQLSERLPIEGGPAKSLRCEHCGRPFGAVYNGAGIAFGQYVIEYDGLAVGQRQLTATVLDRTTTFPCSQCKKERTVYIKKMKR